MKHFRKTFLFSLVTFVVASTVFLGCENMLTDDGGDDGGGDDNNTPETTAEEYYQQGLDALAGDTPDIDAAYQAFQNAVSKDPNHVPAIMALTATELSTAAIDSDMRTFMTSSVGMTSYPSTMNGFLSDAWLMEVEEPSSDPEYSGTLWLPELDGATVDDVDLNGDGALDATEWLYALIGNLAQDNLVNSVIDTMDGTLGQVIGNAISRLDGVSDSATFSLPSDVITLNDGSAVSFGKAEIDLLIAELEVQRAMLKLAQSVDMTVPFGDIWATVESGIPDPVTTVWLEDHVFSPTVDTDTPFSAGLLGLSSDATTAWTAAGDLLESSFARQRDAYDTIVARTGSTLVLSENSDLFTNYIDYDFTDWTSFTNGLKTFSILADKLHASISDTTGSTPAIVPMDFDDPAFQDEYGTDEDLIFAHYSVETNWPVIGEVGVTFVEGQPQATAASVNLGVFFANPVALTSVLFELDTDGEPIFYISDAGAGQPATSASSFTSTTAYTAGADANNVIYYYAKIKDATLNGLIDPDNIDTSVDNTELDNLATFLSYLVGEDSDVAVIKTQDETIEIYIQPPQYAVGASLTTFGSSYNFYEWDSDTGTWVGPTEETSSVGSFWWAIM